MSINERFKRIIETTNTSQRVLAKHWNVSDQFISGLVKGKDRIGMKTFIQILNFWPRLNPRCLLFGDGEMWYSDDKSSIEAVNEWKDKYLKTLEEKDRIRDNMEELLEKYANLNERLKEVESRDHGKM